MLMTNSFRRAAILSSLELLLILLPTVAMAQGIRWSRKIGKDSSLPPMGNLQQKIKNALHKNKVRQKILQGLNIGSPTPSPKELPTKHRDDSSTPWLPSVDAHAAKPAVILAEATEPHRSDSMKFSINPHIRSHLSELKSVSLFISLRLKKKKRRSMAERRQRVQAKLRDKLNKLKNKSCNRKLTTHTKSTNGSTSNSDDSFSLCAPKVIKKAKRLKRYYKRILRSLKSQKVKLIVRLADEKDRKKRTIFNREITVNKFTRVAITIPTKTFKRAADSDNHSMTFQILCKKCRNKVDVHKVYRPQKKSNTEPLRRINHNRPNLVIKFAKKNPKSEPVAVHSRPKRHLPQNFCHLIDDYDSSENSTTTNPPSSENDFECCAQMTYYTFDELGFGDLIIYPRGFTTTLCLGTCSMTGGITVDSRLGNDGSVPLGDEMNYETTTTPAWNQQCGPLDSTHLDVIYFNDTNTLVRGHLSNFIDNSCGCSF